MLLHKLLASSTGYMHTQSPEHLCRWSHNPTFQILR